MKAAIVYYSLEGNTQYVAEKIAKELNADMIRLMPVKEYPTGKVSKYIWGGKSAMHKETPKLKEYRFDAQNYDLVLLGTPIWAQTYAPPLRTFLTETKLAGKKVALFVCSAGGLAENCFAQLEKELSDCAVVSTLRLVNPLKNSRTNDDKQIADFCAKLKAN